MSNLIPRIEFLVQSVVRRRRTCPYCTGRETRVVARKYGCVRVRSCSGCGLFFTDPIYDRSLFGSLYGRLYGAEGSTTERPGPQELVELVASSFRGTDKDAHERLERLGELGGGRRLLEVGSSWGYFLKQAEDEGFEATGIEIDGPRRRFGVEQLGVNILPGIDGIEDGSFDVVYSSHTLEHFTDLSGLFPELQRVLVPGGWLALEVPHFDWERSGRKALATIGAVHPLGFTSEFFRRNLPASGFELQGFFDAWGDVPGRRQAASRGDVVLCLARRSSPVHAVSA